MRIVWSLLSVVLLVASNTLVPHRALAAGTMTSSIRIGSVDVGAHPGWRVRRDERVVVEWRDVASPDKDVVIFIYPSGTNVSDDDQASVGAIGSVRLSGTRTSGGKTIMHVSSRLTDIVGANGGLEPGKRYVIRAHLMGKGSEQNTRYAEASPREFTVAERAGDGFILEAPAAYALYVPVKRRNTSAAFEGVTGVIFGLRHYFRRDISFLDYWHFGIGGYGQDAIIDRLGASAGLGVGLWNLGSVEIGAGYVFPGKSENGRSKPQSVLILASLNVLKL